MYTKILCKSALDGLYGEYKKLMPGWYGDKYGQEEEVDRAWKLYHNAAHTQLSLLLLGEEGLRLAKEELTNFGTTAAYPVLNPKRDQARAIKVVPEGKTKPVFVGASNRTGSILNESDWWPMPNDAWVMGGVHSLTPFYMAMSAIPDDSAVWETRFGGRPRVLGRELIGLATFGYKRIKHGHEGALGIVFGPVDKAKATGATFDAYLAATKNFKSAADIKSIFDDTQSADYATYTKPKL